MKHVAICLFFVVGTFFFTYAQAETNSNELITDSIFEEKTVLCEIDFFPDSYKLTVQAKALLDNVVIQLEQIDTVSKIIRIEGFFGGEDTINDTTRLSMLRALAVEDYLRNQHSAGFERFLTGHNDSNSSCRALIAIYNNPWQDVTNPVQVTNRERTDGPS